MPRAKRGFKARRRRNRLLAFAKGNYSARGRLFRCAILQVRSGWQDAYAHRKARKRDFRRLWIVRINAAARPLGWSYSKLISALHRHGVALDRRALADLALHDPGGFQAVVQTANG